MSAILMELAEPRIRTGSWQSGGFRTDPAGRLRRTGLSTLASVYAPKSQFERHVEKINVVHGHIKGTTESGREFCAADPELLSWVHNTSTYSFIEAARRYGSDLRNVDCDKLVAEQHSSGQYFGADVLPDTYETLTDYINYVGLGGHDSLSVEAHPVLNSLMDLTRSAPIFLPHFRWLQSVFLRAAVDIIPSNIKNKIGLSEEFGMNAVQRKFVKQIGKFSDQVFVPNHPAIQSCRRLGLPEDYLFRNPNEGNVYIGLS